MKRFIVLIGTGTAARTHLESYYQMPKVKVKWVISRDKNRAKIFSQEFNIPKFGTDISEALSETGINTVDICVEPYRQLNIAQLALNKKKDLVLEKPLSHDLNIAEAFVISNYNAPQAIMVNYQYPCSQTFSSLIQICKLKELGDLKSYSIKYHSQRSKEYYSSWQGKKNCAGGGILINQGIHFINLLFHWTGYTPLRVRTKSFNIKHNIEVEDTICAQLYHENGAYGNFSVSTALKDSLDIDLYFDKGLVRTQGGKITIEGKKDEIILTPTKGTFEMVVDDFFSQTNLNPKIKFNFIESLYDLRCIFAMYESSKTGNERIVNFPEIPLKCS